MPDKENHVHQSVVLTATVNKWFCISETIFWEKWLNIWLNPKFAGACFNVYKTIHQPNHSAFSWKKFCFRDAPHVWSWKMKTAPRLLQGVPSLDNVSQ